MTAHSDWTRMYQDWLAEGPTSFDEDVLQATLRHVATTPQGRPVRGFSPDRRRLVYTMTVLAAGIVLAALATAAILRSQLPSVHLPAATPSSPTFQRDALSQADVRSNAALLADGRVLLLTDGMRRMQRVPHAELLNTLTGEVEATGQPSEDRSRSTATRLTDGRVLVVGGVGGRSDVNPGDALASAEIWNPADVSFSATGSLVEARQGHSATLLPDGRVLVIGGNRIGGLFTRSMAGNLASAEAWDPLTGAWTPAGTLATGRSLHSATLLPDGRVLVAGGVGDGGGVAEAEVWDPTTSGFAAAGSLETPRTSHSATPLGDGRVLIVGGFDEGQNADQATLTSAEIWDAATGAFTPAGRLSHARSGHLGTLLPDGRVTIHSGSDTSALVELWDPSSATFSPASSLPSPFRALVAAFRPDGTLLLVGEPESGGARVVDDVWVGSVVVPTIVYVPGWVPASTSTPADPLNELLRRTGGTLAKGVALPDGDLLLVDLVTSGIGGTPLSSVRMWDSSRSELGDSFEVREAHELGTWTGLGDGRVLAVGGFNGPYHYAGYASATAELIDPATGTAAGTGAMASPRVGHTATLLADGRVLVIGDESAEVWDPATGRFSSAGSPSAARTWHTSTLLPDGRVLVVGGWGTASGLGSAELWDPAMATFTPAGTLGAPRSSHTATLLADGRVAVIGGEAGGATIQSVEVWQDGLGFVDGGRLARARLGHTASMLADGRILVIGGTRREDDQAKGLAAVEIWEPADGSTVLTTPLGAGRAHHTTLPLPDGRFLVVAGEQPGRSTGSAEIYDPASGR